MLLAPKELLLCEYLRGNEGTQGAEWQAGRQAGRTHRQAGRTRTQQDAAGRSRAQRGRRIEYVYVEYVLV